MDRATNLAAVGTFPALVRPVSNASARGSNEAMKDCRRGKGARGTLVVVLLAAGLAGVAVDAEGAGSAAPAAKSASCCACAGPPVGPIELRAEEIDDGWELHFARPPFAGYTAVFARFDDRPETSTGHERWLDVMTGKPHVRDWIIVPYEWVTPGAHRLDLRLVRFDGRAETRRLRFDAAAERLALAKRTLAQLGERAFGFAEHGDEVTWLGFTVAFSHRDSLREVRYSVNDCALGERIVFSADFDAEPTAERNPEYPNDLILDRPFLTLPKATTHSACVQVVFRDGTTSNVLEIRRVASEKP